MNYLLLNVEFLKFNENFDTMDKQLISGLDKKNSLYNPTHTFIKLFIIVRCVLASAVVHIYCFIFIFYTLQL